jgi:hypothetical protein
MMTLEGIMMISRTLGVYMHLQLADGVVSIIMYNVASQAPAPILCLPFAALARILGPSFRRRCLSPLAL